MLPPWADIRAEVEYPHFTNRIFLPAPLVALHSSLVQVKTLAFCLFSPQQFQVSALCFAHRHSWILQVQCFRLAYCDGSTRIGKSLCVPHHTDTLHREGTLRGFVVYSRHAPFTQAGPWSRAKCWQTLQSRTQSCHHETSGVTTQLCDVLLVLLEDSAKRVLEHAGCDEGLGGASCRGFCVRARAGDRWKANRSVHMMWFGQTFKGDVRGSLDDSEANVRRYEGTCGEFLSRSREDRSCPEWASRTKTPCTTCTCTLHVFRTTSSCVRKSRAPSWLVILCQAQRP